jgi:hypothetical protein
MLLTKRIDAMILCQVPAQASNPQWRNFEIYLAGASLLPHDWLQQLLLQQVRKNAYIKPGGGLRARLIRADDTHRTSPIPANQYIFAREPAQQARDRSHIPIIHETPK